MRKCESIAMGGAPPYPVSMILFVGSPITRTNRDINDSFTHVIQMSHLMIYFHLGGLTSVGPSRSYGGDSVGAGSPI